VQLTREPIGDPPSPDQYWVSDSEIFYVTPGGADIRSLPYSARGDRIVVGQPGAAFKIPKGSALIVTSDGSRALAASSVGPARPAMVSIVQNWQSALRKH
jgi:hypothetical protein